MKRTLFILILVGLLLPSISWAQTAPAGSLWAVVLTTKRAGGLIDAGVNFDSYTTLGELTIFMGRDSLLELLKTKGISHKAFPLKPKELVWLIATRDRNFHEIKLPGVKVLMKVKGFRVILADEVTKMGLASKLSDFATLEPLPVNTVVLTPPRSPEEPPSEDPILKLLERLDPEAFFADVQALADLKTRYTYGQGADKALDYCEKVFKKLELPTKRLPFSSSGSKRENLEAIQKGFDSTNAGEVIIIGHLDSTSPQATTLAPGADDNGSGAAGVLALARFMKGLNPRASVRYVLVLGEEQGLLGSKAYVVGLKPEEIAKIRGVINMDMIGFDEKSPPSMVIETASFNSQMAEHMSDLAAKYTNLTSQISYNYWGSDHVPFLKKEIPTVLTIESEYDDNPTYHQTTDVPEKINRDLCHGILRLNAAELAQLSSVDRQPRK